MDRQIVYIGAIPQDTDQLQQNKNTMIGLGYALQAILGTSTVVDGLACTPNSPAALNVLVAPGSIYGLQNVNGTAYGSLAPDTTDQIIKQGIIMPTTTLSCPAPATTGQSVVYLVQVAYQDTDSGSTVLPYYNAANPSVAWSGPSNSGVSQNTVRKGVCTVAVKTGIAATTGTQVTPSPDAGFTGLYAVTVANGQTTITSGNIQQLATAPIIGTKLPAILSAIQADSPNYAADTSGSANTITVALSPVPSALTSGMPLRVKVANTNTGATVMNVNGLGNVSVVTANGSALSSGALQANGIYTFVYDANGTRWQVQAATAASTNNLFTGGTTTGSANAQVLASLSPTSGFSLSNNGQVIICRAGFSNTGGAMTLAITSPSISATPVKIATASGYTNPPANSVVLNEMTAFVVDSVAGVFVIDEGFAGGQFLQIANALSELTGSAATARSNISAAKSGANTDITSLQGSALIATAFGVGSQILATNNSGSTIAPGGTTSGSNLIVTGFANAGGGTMFPTSDSAPSGTWQAMQTTLNSVGAAASGGIFQRIA